MSGIALKIEIKEKQWDLLVVIVLAALLVIVALTVKSGPLRIFLAILFVIFLPGYVIVSALFPKAKDLDTIERIALSFGISIAIVPLIGLILNYSPWGIRLHPMLVSLFVMTISVAIAAWYRRSQISIEDRFSILISLELPKEEDFTLVDKILTIVLVLAVIIAISVMYYVITVPKEGEHYTEFHILDENRTMEDYPSNLTIDEYGTVIVGVICHEHERTTYTVEIELINLTGERENRTLRQYNLTLEHNQHNETVCTFNVSDNGTYKIQFLLYINDDEEPYRELYLWITVKP